MSRICLLLLLLGPLLGGCATPGLRCEAHLRPINGATAAVPALKLRQRHAQGSP
jgi:hypothetical protein